MRKVILVSMLVCCVGLVESAAGVTYNFGGEWDIDFDVGSYVFIRDNSTEGPTTVNLLDGGYVCGVEVFDNSVFNMFGGKIRYSDLGTHDNSTVYICGGVVGRGLYLYGQSQLTIEGTGFNYPHGTYTNMAGYLTGHLLNGDPIATPFYLYDSATMTLVPEPATLLLLGLGAVMLRRNC